VLDELGTIITGRHTICPYPVPGSFPHAKVGLRVSREKPMSPTQVKIQQLLSVRVTPRDYEASRQHGERGNSGSWCAVVVATCTVYTPGVRICLSTSGPIEQSTVNNLHTRTISYTAVISKGVVSWTRDLVAEACMQTRFKHTDSRSCINEA
jgi:hypothetical protein